MTRNAISAETRPVAAAPALKDAARPAPEQAKMEAIWGTSGQVIYGERMTLSDGKTIYKIVTVNIPLPKGLNGREVLAAALRGLSADGKSLNPNMIRSFNQSDSLLAHFDSSSARTAGMVRRLFTNLYAASHLTVQTSLDAHSEDYLRFERLNATLHEGSVTLDAELRGILSVPHRCAVMLPMEDKRFGGAIRQEWIFDGNMIQALDVYGKVMSLTSIAGDTNYGHKEFLAWLVQEVLKAYLNGDQSFIAHTLDGTFDVASCASCRPMELFYEQSMARMQEAQRLAFVDIISRHAEETQKRWTEVDTQRAKEARLSGDARADSLANVCHKCGEAFYGSHACGAIKA